MYQLNMEIIHFFVFPTGTIDRLLHINDDRDRADRFQPLRI
ncbi:hypothetical protein [Microcoleus asticus]|nr:hypothetical protein [Microcoleus asticus]